MTKLSIFLFLLLTTVSFKYNSSEEIHSILKVENILNENTIGDSEILANWWLNGQICITSGLCCCADGNSYYCDTASGLQFTCVPGGPFSCDAELGKCAPNPSADPCGCCPGASCHA